jgi:hypothetical protein
MHRPPFSQTDTQGGEASPSPLLEGNEAHGILQGYLSQHQNGGNANTFCKVHSAESGGRVGNISPSKNLWLMDNLPWAGNTCLCSRHRCSSQKAWPVEAAHTTVMPA